jgi:hypothetical protein
MPKKTIFFCIGILCAMPLFSQTRSLEAVFPRLSPETAALVFSPQGFIQSLKKNEGFHLLDSSGLNPRITGAVLGGDPLFLIETLLVVPQTNKTLLDIYNALGNVRNLKGRLYHSSTRNQNVPLFEDATRIAGERKNSPIQDPGPAASVPASETIYLRIKDANFGNTFYREELSREEFGLRYRLSNYKNLSYLLMPVIKEEKFVAQIYLEPVAEGILIYSIAGVDVSDFISSRIDMASAVSKRLDVIIAWVVDGINAIP